MWRAFALMLSMAALLWVAALLAGPHQLAAQSTVAAWFYEGCGLICHQRPDRSFLLDGVPMPVCGRCLGLYASGAAGVLVASIRFSRPERQSGMEPRTVRTLLLWAALPTAATLFVEWSGWLQPGTAGRAVAAVPLGWTVGWVLVRTICTDGAAVAPQQMRYHA